MEPEKIRTLSAAEEARSRKFEKTKQALFEEGYAAKDMTVDMSYIMVMTFALALPIIAVFAVLFILLNMDVLSNLGITLDLATALKLAIFIVVFFALAVVHELIHGITWAAFAKKHWKAISFGIIMENMTPYCTCDEALTKGQYIVGAIMPTIILGVIPSIAAVITGSLWVFVMGAFMILSGGGDLTIIWKLLRSKIQEEEVLCMDHPYEVGLVAFVR